MSPKTVSTAALKVYVLRVLRVLFLFTPHFFSLTKAIFNKMIQKRFLNYRENRIERIELALFMLFILPIAFSFGNTVVVPSFEIWQYCSSFFGLDSLVENTLT